MAKDYVKAALAGRRSTFSSAAFVTATLFLLFAWMSYYRALEPIPHASEGYQVAVRASRFGSMGWALFWGMTGLWMYAKAARNFFALPSIRGLGSFARGLRTTAVVILLSILSLGSCEPGARVDGYSDDRWLLGGAAGVVWLLFAIDLWPLMRNAIVSLRTRARAARGKPSSVGGHEVGAVQMSGKVCAGEQVLREGASELVYRHSIAADGALVAEHRSFLLEADGRRLFVDTDPARTVVVPDDENSSENVMKVRVGDTVEVWGEVSRSEGAYRGQPARLGAGEGQLYIFAGRTTLGQRLLRAALVEVAACVAFLSLGVTFGFFVFDLYLFLI